MHSTPFHIAILIIPFIFYLVFLSIRQPGRQDIILIQFAIVCYLCRGKKVTFSEHTVVIMYTEGVYPEYYNVTLKKTYNYTYDC